VLKLPVRIASENEAKNVDGALLKRLVAPLWLVKIADAKNAARRFNLITTNPLF
jgi:hypothetical protein